MNCQSMQETGKFWRLNSLKCRGVFAAIALSASLNTHSVQAGGQYKKAADNKIYAQFLVNELMSANHDLLVVGLHAVAPKATDETMIASNLDRIGKKDDYDDIAVATLRKTILAPNLKEPDKFEVQVPLKDAKGNVIGATGLVFKYHQGDDEIKLHARALSIRDELAQKIPDLAALFKAL